jgi:hypothetical protein
MPSPSDKQINDLVPESVEGGCPNYSVKLKRPVAYLHPIPVKIGLEINLIREEQTTVKSEYHIIGKALWGSLWKIPGIIHNYAL